MKKNKIILTDLDMYYYWSLFRDGSLAQQFNGSKLKKRDKNFIDWVQEKIRKYPGAVWSVEQNAYVSSQEEKEE